MPASLRTALHLAVTATSGCGAPLCRPICTYAFCALQRCHFASPEACSRHSDGLTLTLAIGYSGRRDLAAAARSLAAAAATGDLLPDEIDEQKLQGALSTSRAWSEARLRPSKLFALRSSSAARLMHKPTCRLGSPTSSSGPAVSIA